jgi:hypothetical protein
MLQEVVLGSDVDLDKIANDLEGYRQAAILCISPQFACF